MSNSSTDISKKLKLDSKTTVDDKKSSIRVEDTINELKNIFDNFYLSKIIVAEDNKSVLLKKSYSGIRNLLDPGTKITKSRKNKKVLAASELLTQLSILKTNLTKNDYEKIIEINKIITELYSRYSHDTGNFGKAVRFAKSYIDNIQTPAPLVLIDKESVEFKIIENKFVKDARSFKKIPKKLDFGILAKDNILKTLIQPVAEFCGEDVYSGQK